MANEELDPTVSHCNIVHKEKKPLHSEYGDEIMNLSRITLFSSKDIRRVEVKPPIERPESVMDRVQKWTDHKLMEAATGKTFDTIKNLPWPEIFNLTASEVMRSLGVGEAEAEAILFASNIGKNIVIKAIMMENRVLGPEQAYDYFHSRPVGSRVEGLYAIYMDNDNRPVYCQQIQPPEDLMGDTLSFSASPPPLPQETVKSVFATALQKGAAKLIMVRNVGKAATAPLKVDFLRANQMVKAGNTLGIGVMDYLMFNEVGFVSLREMYQILKKERTAEVTKNSTGKRRETRYSVESASVEMAGER